MKIDTHNVESRLMYYRRIGLNIAYYRKQKNWIQEDLAQESSMSRSYISHIEAPNEKTNYSMSTLLDIALALEVDPSKLLEAR